MIPQDQRSARVAKRKEKKIEKKATHARVQTHARTKPLNIYCFVRRLWLFFSFFSARSRTRVEPSRAERSADDPGSRCPRCWSHSGSSHGPEGGKKRGGGERDEGKKERIQKNRREEKKTVCNNPSKKYRQNPRKSLVEDYPQTQDSGGNKNPRFHLLSERNPEFIDSDWR